PRDIYSTLDTWNTGVRKGLVMKNNKGLYFSACIAIIITSVLTGCKSQQQNLHEITLPMGYVANVQFSPLYVAKERGYFTDAGFDVTFDYRWETDGIQLVAAGKTPFSIASGDQVIQARSKGLPVIAIASWYGEFPVAIISQPDIPLNSPSDLENLSIGIPETFGASYIGLRALLESGRLTENDINLQVIGYSQLAMLTSEKVDAVVVYANNEPVVLSAENVDYNILHVADHASIVSAVLISSDNYIEENPEATAAFVSAFLKGVAEAADDLETAFEISKSYVEGLAENESVQFDVLQASANIWQTSHLGIFSSQSWDAAQSIMLQAGLIEQTVDIETLYTNEFIP
ncbi:MAG: ABC transporter substrate-binding protein, partial [Anaerolineae bacterium]|nr:ABC transporter substrate-binding protein [Anaerolineae bacterium]